MKADTNEVLRRRLSIEEVDFDEDDIIESKKIDPIKTNEKIVKVWNHNYGANLLLKII